MAIDAANILRRAIGVAKLDVPTIEEVEADDSATTEAGIVVVVSAIIGSLGALFTNGLWAFIVWIAVMLIGWYIWAWMVAFLAERLFKVQTTDTGEMLRVIGYGSAPRAIGIIPLLGFVAGIWTIIVLVVAIRQAGEMTTGQAIITAILGWIPTIVGMSIAFAIL